MPGARGPRYAGAVAWSCGRSPPLGAMTAIPEPLARLLHEVEGLDRFERQQLLLEFADEFREVPPEVAERPFPEENYVTRCESQAYVFARPNPDGTLKFYFAVENPQGVSAKSWAVIMDRTLSGQPLESVLAVPPDVIFRIYGNEISMGKGQGLMGMLDHVKMLAARTLRERRSEG